MEHGEVLTWDDDQQKFLRNNHEHAVFTEEELRKMIIDCVHGLEYCKHLREVVLSGTVVHFNQIVHRDIKPQNILVDNTGTFKIADFGVSMLLGGSGASERDTGNL